MCLLKILFNSLSLFFHSIIILSSADLQIVHIPSLSNEIPSQVSGKQHLEHVIPQNKIITAYLHDKLSAELVLQMPLCMIDDADKHILEGDWQQSGNWEFPFRRYLLAGYTKVIKDVRGNQVDLNTHSLKDHFEMLGENV